MPITASPTFWIVSPRPMWGFDPTVCQQMIAEIVKAMSKVLESGVVEYHVGSRGLRRFTFAELQSFLLFWQNQLQASLMGSAIVCRRAIPTDT